MSRTISCPHCGAEVVRITPTRKGFTFAEPLEDGPWILSKLSCDRDPLAIPVGKYGRGSDVLPGSYGPHDCAHLVDTADDLATVREVYGRRKRGPVITVPAERVAELSNGDELTVRDQAGHQVRGQLVGRQAAIRLKLTTYRKTPA